MNLTREQEVDLFQRYKSGDREAQAILVHRNMGLVHTVARKFTRFSQALEDLVQEGCVGLTIAIDRYEPERGHRFITYASFWVKSYILSYIVRTWGPVRIGQSTADRKAFFNLRKIRQALERSGEKATAESLAKALGVKDSVVEAMLPRMDPTDISLDSPDRNGSFRSVPIESHEEIVVSNDEVSKKRSRLNEALSVLDERERYVIEERYLNENQATMQTVGDKLGVCRERVRQIEVRAIKKLKSAIEGTKIRRL